MMPAPTTANRFTLNRCHQLGRTIKEDSRIFVSRSIGKKSFLSITHAPSLLLPEGR